MIGRKSLSTTRNLKATTKVKVVIAPKRTRRRKQAKQIRKASASIAVSN